MEYTKTALDKQREAVDLSNDPVLIFLKNQDDQRFNIGDILTRMYKYGDEWKSETFSSTTDVSKKYLYAFENTLGIGYVKSFKTNGQLSEVSTCLTELISDSCRFALDPEYADHILLSGGEEFKPVNSFKEKKKFRDKAIANNKALLVPKDAVSIVAWMNNLKVGDKFYCGGHIPDMVKCYYEVVSFRNVKISNFDTYRSSCLIRDLGLTQSDYVKEFELKILKHPYFNIGSIHKPTVADFLGQSITDKEPFPLTEIQ